MGKLSCGDILLKRAVLLVANVGVSYSFPLLKTAVRISLSFIFLNFPYFQTTSVSLITSSAYAAATSSKCDQVVQKVQVLE